MERARRNLPGETPLVLAPAAAARGGAADNRIPIVSILGIGHHHEADRLVRPQFQRQFADLARQLGAM
jgi:hypothetical protein